ncbi:MAG TPA: von Willebrand factor type A domain-containing protein [Candidatus Krumholzibacteria bacterium]|nr:von Willebrand factor type A domain-containing protein [Candidatus Krumholzibacteria bacterium]HPD70950.1 von Willebrand factor type A domain-containing protein [Candidatus Krumholzibacteria bacterium]HRY39350.1 von Willebrand factor type A domain-containing protein [Candidatus Krumholzibacteria bacterium]
MTRQEYRKAFRLTDREKAQVWREISSTFRPARAQPRRWLPALGGVAAVACAIAAAVLLMDPDQGRGPQLAAQDDAVHPSAPPAAASPAPDAASRTSTATRDEAASPPTLVEDPQASQAPQIAAGQAEASQPALAQAAKSHPAGGPTTPARAQTTVRDVTTGDGAIRGVVRDAVTGAPIAGATVIADGGSRGTIADSLGVFVFTGLVPGEHTLEVSFLGYETVTTALTVVAADTATTVVALVERTGGIRSPIDVDAGGPDVAILGTGAARDPVKETFDQYAIAPGKDAASRDRAVARPSGQPYVDGGRGGEVESRIDGSGVKPLGDPAAPAPTVGHESGGTRNPNDRPYDLVYHQHYGVNPFVATDEDALSTFAVEVDDASWTVARRYLTDGHLPPAEAIRLEEIVNRLAPGFAADGRDDFTLHADGMPSRFGEGYQLLRIGVRARDVAAAERRPAHLVFVIDVSGSMQREDRLELVKRALRVLVAELQEGDRVGIVVYGSEARVVLEPTAAEDRVRILAAIDALQPSGSTNAEAGLRLAYEMARRSATRGANDRLVLCSDGVANVGATGAESILAAVGREADEGITLTTVGFGMGNYNDVLMEQLANQGDGTYHYVQRLEDAERVFRQNLTGTLQNVGREVKTQVEFDPAAVVRWRLLGYENRDVADRDFRNDAIDAGEIGAGHTAVALYEIKLSEQAARDLARGDRRVLGVVRLRWAKPRYHPDAGEVTEIERRLTSADLAPSWDQAGPRLRAAALAAEFAEILRESYWARDSRLADLVDPATALVSELPADPDVLELAQMIRRAADLDARREPARPAGPDKDE